MNTGLHHTDTTPPGSGTPYASVSFARTVITRYARYAPTLALLFGFVFDVFTLQRPDELFENVAIVGYLLLSALVMVLLQTRRSEQPDDKWRVAYLSVLQFSFGNLASALMVLYARSGTLTGSAIFIGMLASLFLGNELLKNRYARTQLRVMIWFALLLTYSTLIVPVIFNSLGIIIFIISITSALLITFVLVALLARVSHVAFRAHARNIFASVIAITIGFSTLYAQNLIPPVPLSLKHIGIYHSVARVDTSYTVTFEQPAWYVFWRQTNDTFTLPSNATNTTAYCFSSVFAPSKLKTEIRHVWERYEPSTETWITVSEIPYPISGGREHGYRGFTYTRQVSEGRWRCSVETKRGALIGRTEFTVEHGESRLVVESL